ncbi:MAG: BspA family leucine-rich repeat surface protein [Patescibacteria group bacterium]
MNNLIKVVRIFLVTVILITGIHSAHASYGGLDWMVITAPNEITITYEHSLASYDVSMYTNLGLGLEGRAITAIVATTSNTVTISFDGPPVPPNTTGSIDVGPVDWSDAPGGFAGGTEYPVDDGLSPTLGALTLQDLDTSGTLTSGDTVSFRFNEPMNPNITADNINTFLGLSNGHTFGTVGQGLAIAWTNSTTTLVVTVATDATLASGDTILPTEDVIDASYWNNPVIVSGSLAIPVTATAPRTLHFFSSLSYDSWNTLTNWWNDAGHTVHASSLPNAYDNVVIDSTVTPDDSADYYIRSLTMSEIPVDGQSDIGLNFFYMNIRTSDGIIVNSNWNFAGSIIGDTTFNGFAAAGLPFGIVGNASFYFGLSNIIGNVTFNASTTANYGTIMGNTAFHGEYGNAGLIYGNTTFNDSTSNPGIVFGNVIFRDQTFNSNGTIHGDVDVYSPAEYPLSGSVDGTIRYHGYAMSISVHAPSRTITLDVDPSDTIENIKTKIQDQIGLAPQYQTLSFDGTPLVDGQTLAHYSIGASDTVDLAISSPEFIFTVKTDNAGVSDDHSFEIPTANGMTYNYDVDWGDGATTTGTTTNAFHTYAAAGLHQIKVTGTFPAMLFIFAGDKDKLIAIDQWGTNHWLAMGSMFAGCSHVTFAAYDAPDLSGVTDLIYTFRASGLRSENLNGWDVSNITYFLGTFQDTPFNGNISGWNMSGAVNTAAMFYNDTAFNGDVSAWDVSHVTSMSAMFAYDAAFNNGGQPLSWGSKTSNVADMSAMFYQASSFNQDVSGWNVSNVTNMNSMFESATSFNNSDVTNAHHHPILWGSQTSKVTNMQGMFSNAQRFNQDIGSWDTSQVTTMAYMLSGATLFDQDLGGWDLSNITTMDNAFSGTALSTRHYDTSLTGWSGQLLQHDVVVGAPNSHYCNAGEARTVLMSDPLFWTINDAGHACVTPPSVSFDGSTPNNNATLVATTSIDTGLSMSATGNRYSFVNSDHSLEGWWRFERNGQDDSGKNDANVWTGTERYSYGAFGDAGYFDGGSSFDVVLHDPIQSSFTVSTWVYLNSVTEGAAIIGDENGHLLQIGGSSRWQFDNAYSADAVASPRIWTHVVGVYDASNEMETLYVNGMPVSSVSGTRAVAAALNIGKRNDGIFIFGKIDDVMVWSRALGADEVAALHDSEQSGYGHSFNDLSYGNHSFKGYVVDDNGTAQSTEERTVTVRDPNQQDTQQPVQTPAVTVMSHSGSRISYIPVAPSVKVATSSRQWVRDLTFGMSGSDVLDLQKFLISAKSGPAGRALSAHGATNYFGALTRNALAELQKKNGIRPAVGYFGPKTRGYVTSKLQ